MRTEEIKIYKFYELSEEIQEKVIEKEKTLVYGNATLLDFWQDDWVRNIKDMGFYNPEIRYSLGYCQGDGASVKFDHTQISELNLSHDKLIDIKNEIWDFIDNINSIEGLKKEIKKLIFECLESTKLNSYKTSFSNLYWHNKTIKCDTIEFYDYAYIEELEGVTDDIKKELINYIDIFCINLETTVTEFLENIGREIERSGYEEIEYQTSTECIKEQLLSDELEYTEKGEIY